MPRDSVQKDQNDKEEKVEKNKKTGSGKKLVIIFALVLLLFSAGAFLAIKTGAVGGVLGDRFQQEPVQKEPEFMYPVPEIVVNLAGGRQFLSVKFYLGFDEPKLEQEIEKRMPEIRDAVLNILWDKDADDINAPDGKDHLRAEIFQVVDGLLNSGELREVYFWHVMIQ